MGALVLTFLHRRANTTLEYSQDIGELPHPQLSCLFSCDDAHCEGSRLAKKRVIWHTLFGNVRVVMDLARYDRASPGLK